MKIATLQLTRLALIGGKWNGTTVLPNEAFIRTEAQSNLGRFHQTVHRLTCEHPFLRVTRAGEISMCNEDVQSLDAELYEIPELSPEFIAQMYDEVLQTEARALLELNRFMVELGPSALLPTASDITVRLERSGNSILATVASLRFIEPFRLRTSTWVAAAEAAYACVQCFRAYPTFKHSKSTVPSGHSDQCD